MAAEAAAAFEVDLSEADDLALFSKRSRRRSSDVSSLLKPLLATVVVAVVVAVASFDAASVLVELADMKEANRSYQASLQIYRQARELHAMTLDLLKQ